MSGEQASTSRSTSQQAFTDSSSTTNLPIWRSSLTTRRTPVLSRGYEKRLRRRHGMSLCLISRADSSFLNLLNSRHAKVLTDMPTAGGAELDEADFKTAFEEWRATAPDVARR